MSRRSHKRGAPSGAAVPYAQDFAARSHPSMSYQQRLDLPLEVIEQVMFRLPTLGEITVVWPNDRARRRGGDYLRLRPASKTHKHATWYVNMRPARGGYKKTWSTECRFDELDAAKMKYLDCLVDLRRVALNRRNPRGRFVVDVLLEFVTHMSERCHDLLKISEGRLKTIMRSAAHLLRRFDGVRVAELNKSTSAKYMAWGLAERPAGGGYEYNTARGDVAVLLQALTTMLNDESNFYRCPFDLPEEKWVSIEVFSPEEIERVPIAAEAGWIWHAESNDWLRDDAGDYVVRRTEVARAALPYGRLFQIAIWFGSRLEVNLNFTWTDEGGPWIDLDRKIVHRLGKNEEETTKRKGFCLIPDEFLPILRQWRDGDLARGCKWVIHTWDYRRIRQMSYGVWNNLLAAAGAPALSPHACKHTCVWILKLEEVSLAATAYYLFTTEQTLVKYYGPDWDVRGTRAAAQAMGSQKLYKARHSDEAARVAILRAEAATPPLAANDAGQASAVA